MPKNPFDADAWSREAARLEPRLKFSASNPDDAKRWQCTLRRQFIKRLGGLSKPDAPPAHKVGCPFGAGVDEFPDYTRESVRIQSRATSPIFAYFLLPKERAKPLPAILCLHGHGYGVDAIVGLDAHGKPRDGAEYQNDFALQAVRRGYAVLAIEILGFGRRREGQFALGSGDSSCLSLSGTALMVGQSMAGWRVFDAMRSIDYLQTRSEVDANRIGAMGISGGGLNTLYLAAVDTRVKAAMVSGFLNTFRDSIMALPHCIDNFVPGLLLDAEMSDIAALVAPRALWCESGARDPIFPVAPFRRALRDVRAAYKVLCVGDKCNGEVFDGDHFFYGAGAWPFLARHLALEN